MCVWLQKIEFNKGVKDRNSEEEIFLIKFYLFKK